MASRCDGLISCALSQTEPRAESFFTSLRRRRSQNSRTLSLSYLRKLLVAFAGTAEISCRVSAPTRTAACSFTENGDAKPQETLSDQMTKLAERRLGVHLTPHQPRHLAATWYLDEHPEDFQTPKAFLGHAWEKTTRIYAGSSSRRAGRAYNRFLFEQREMLKLKRKRRPNRKPKPSGSSTTTRDGGGDDPCES